jgi:hypothetical protein
VHSLYICLLAVQHLDPEAVLEKTLAPLSVLANITVLTVGLNSVRVWISSPYDDDLQVAINRGIVYGVIAATGPTVFAYLGAAGVL